LVEIRYFCEADIGQRALIIHSVDYRALIKELRLRAEALDRAIADIESLNSPAGSTELQSFKKRRGRRFMGQEERQQVSERMRRYWAGRRDGKGRAAKHAIP
jgi:hypothetical protein